MRYHHHQGLTGWLMLVKIDLQHDLSSSSSTSLSSSLAMCTEIMMKHPAFLFCKHRHLLLSKYSYKTWRIFVLVPLAYHCVCYRISQLKNVTLSCVRHYMGTCRLNDSWIDSYYVNVLNCFVGESGRWKRYVWHFHTRSNIQRTCSCFVVIMSVPASTGWSSCVLMYAM